MEKFGGSAFIDRSGGRAAASIPTSANAATVVGAATNAAAAIGGVEEGREKTGVADWDSSDYGLVDGEGAEEELGQATNTVRAEGLNLINDINFLSDDVEAELERILGPTEEPITATNTNNINNASNRILNDVSDEDTSITGCIEDISVNFSDAGSISEKYSPCVTSTTQKEKKSSLFAADSPLGERSSIAVQTLSTGDIMATQIFHDMT